MCDKPHEYLAELVKQRRIIKDILEDADPASGISFMIRRGVARDNKDVPRDSDLRPWATIQTCDLELAAAAIDSILKANRQSMTTFIEITRRDIDIASGIVAVACDELGVEQDPNTSKKKR
jgi:hypothetical protein